VPQAHRKQMPLGHLRSSGDRWAAGQGRVSGVPLAPGDSSPVAAKTRCGAAHGRWGGARSCSTPTCFSQEPQRLPLRVKTPSAWCLSRPSGRLRKSITTTGTAPFRSLPATVANGR